MRHLKSFFLEMFRSVQYAKLERFLEICIVEKVTRHTKKTLM